MQHAGHILGVFNNEGEIALARWHRGKRFKRRAVAIGAAGGRQQGLQSQIKEQCSSWEVMLLRQARMQFAKHTNHLAFQHEAGTAAWMQAFVIV